MESIWITDVSPRDGLQNQAKLLSTGDKLALIGLLVAAGLQRVEVTSFVSPKAVPQMADAADLLSLVIEQFPQLQSTAFWQEALDAVRIPNGPVNNFAQALNSAQVRARQMVVSVALKNGQSLEMPGNPIKLSGAAEPRYTCPPGLGEHTERVLRELVGYSTEQLTHLKRAGVIA